MIENENFVANKIFLVQQLRNFWRSLFDNRLTFNYDASYLYKTASRKLHALTRVVTYMDQDEKQMFFGSCFSSQFYHCSLIRMNLTRSINYNVKKVYETAFRSGITQSRWFCNNTRKNNQAPTTFINNFRNNIAQVIAPELYSLSSIPWNLRNGSHFQKSSKNTVRKTLETVFYIVPKNWSIVPEEIKNLPSFFLKKSNIGYWRVSLADCARYNCIA